MTIRVRTSPERATLLVACANDTHVVHIASDGVVSMRGHDDETDRVMLALGAERHACQIAAAAYEAAQVTFLALQGIQDAPDLVAPASRWASTHRCSVCPSRYGIFPRHVNSLPHQVSRLGTHLSAARTLLSWLIRNDRTARGEPRGRVYDDDLVINGTGGQWITPAFRAALDCILGEGASAQPSDNSQYIPTDVYVRQHGVKVQWLRAIAHGLSEDRRRLIQSGDFRVSKGALISARNVSPRKVALYMDAGINAHFHTYSRSGVEPHVALDFYRRSGGVSLAEMIQAGVNVPDAFRGLAERVHEAGSSDLTS